MHQNRMFPSYPQGPGGHGEPGHPGHQQQGAGMPPSSPPPSFIPQHGATHGGHYGTQAVSPGSIIPCLYRYVYIWPNFGPGFWAWLTYAGRRSIAGYRWTGHRWVYFGMDTHQISSFVCY